MRSARLLLTQLRASLLLALQYRAEFLLDGFVEVFWMVPAIVPLAVVLMIGGAGVLRYDHTANPPPQFSTAYYLREHVAQTMISPSSDRAWSDYILTSANSDAQAPR